MGYENYSMNQAIKLILPKDTAENEIPSGFEIIGDIAHLNLSQSILNYKFQIGQVVLDKNPSLKTVVCKVG